jgi:lipopolysaccharide transport system ATP-binding protein
MYVRLAFAVAAHLNPEILIVDEVLAVGDAAFQRKCLGKMKDVARNMGRTVLFVSHNMIAVRSLCRHAVMLGNGRVLKEGDTASVIGDYLLRIQGNESERAWEDVASAPGTHALRIRRVTVTAANTKTARLTMDSTVRVETTFSVVQSRCQLHLTYHLLNDEGIIVLTTACVSAARNVGTYTATFEIPGNLLNSGGYSLKLLIVQNENQVVYECPSIASFHIFEDAARTHACLGREPGVVQLQLSWELRTIGSPEIVLT